MGDVFRRLVPSTLAQQFAGAAVHPGAEALVCFASQAAAMCHGPQRGWRRGGLPRMFEDQERLLQRIPRVPHLQCTWLLLYCGAPRCTYLLRTLPRADTAAFVDQHDAAVLNCLGSLLAGGEKLKKTSQARARALRKAPVASCHLGRLGPPTHRARGAAAAASLSRRVAQGDAWKPCECRCCAACSAARVLGGVSAALTSKSGRTRCVPSARSVSQDAQ